MAQASDGQRVVFHPPFVGVHSAAKRIIELHEGGQAFDPAHPAECFREPLERFAEHSWRLTDAEKRDLFGHRPDFSLAFFTRVAARVPELIKRYGLPEGAERWGVPAPAASMPVRLPGADAYFET
ncbi:MAG: hypothetical protein KGI41_01390 [Patescibacteria group bacterium]|nr:hypothetical protein [Patescibacteria group bacterium]MDE1965881.1 hypothetical protein [Patescibacteria group bacterium]